MQRLCPRCRYAIAYEDDGALCFCPHCGAAQVRLSEELREQAEAQLRQAPEAGQAAAADSVPPPPREVDRLAVNWRGAILCAGLAGAVALVIELISIPLPVFDFLSTLWAMGAPIVALGLYSARFRETVIRPAFGARLGLLCGAAIVVGVSSVDLVHALVSRFVFHAAGAIDSQTAAIFAQIKQNTLQQTGQSAAAAGPLLAVLDIPEFRAGFFLSVIGVMIALYLAFSATGGAFAGFLRARSAKT